jgi:hypothetical protein
LLERVKFGLPLGGRFNNNPAVKGKSFMVEASHPITRRSSPLIVKVIRSGASYVPVLVVLEGAFLPDGVTLMLKDKSKNTAREKTQAKSYTDDNVVEHFIKTKLRPFEEVKI